MSTSHAVKHRLSLDTSNLEASRALRISPTAQDEMNWCWAACAQMVLKYRGNSLRQCQVANLFFNVNNCCDAPHRYDVGRSSVQSKNFYLAQGYRNTVLVNRALTFREIQDEINRDRPIEATIDWNFSDGSHAVLIRGWETDHGQETLHVNDPQNGYEDSVAYSFLLSGYGHGTWSQSIYGM